MRYVHRVKQEAAQQGVEPDMRQGEAAAITPAGRIQSIGPRDDRAQSRAHPATPSTPPVAAPVRKAEPVKPYWYAPYMTLRQDWNAFIEGARQAGIMTFYAKGYADMIPRIQALAENPDVPAVTRAPMMQVLENHQRYLSTRQTYRGLPGPSGPAHRRTRLHGTPGRRARHESSRDFGLS